MRIKCSFVLSLGFLAALVMFAPEGAAAQSSCWGSCHDCVGGGHSYGTEGNPAMGLEEHPCGGVKCKDRHGPCLQFDVGTEEYLQLLRDAERLQTYETLTGTELGEIVGRSSLMYVNVKRRALQQVYCTDKTLVVFNLPLSPTQWAEFVATGPLDQ